MANVDMIDSCALDGFVFSIEENFPLDLVCSLKYAVYFKTLANCFFQLFLSK